MLDPVDEVRNVQVINFYQSPKTNHWNNIWPKTLQGFDRNVSFRNFYSEKENNTPIERGSRDKTDNPEILSRVLPPAAGNFIDKGGGANIIERIFPRVLTRNFFLSRTCNARVSFTGDLRPYLVNQTFFLFSYIVKLEIESDDDVFLWKRRNSQVACSVTYYRRKIYASKVCTSLYNYSSVNSVYKVSFFTACLVRYTFC